MVPSSAWNMDRKTTVHGFKATETIAIAFATPSVFFADALTGTLVFTLTDLKNAAIASFARSIGALTANNAQSDSPPEMNSRKSAAPTEPGLADRGLSVF